MKNANINPAVTKGGVSNLVPLTILSVIIILGGFLRLFKLGVKNLWLDEYIMRSYVGLTYKNLWNHPYLDGNISYPTMVQKFLFGLFPENEFYMRLPTAILSIASLFTIYLLGKTLYSHREGIAASLLLAFSQYHIYMAQEFKLAYMTVTMLYPIAIFSLIKGLEKGSVRYWVIFIITILSLFYMHFLIIPSIFSLIALMGFALILLLLKPALLKDILGFLPSSKPFFMFALSLAIILIAYIPMLSVLNFLLHSPYGFGGKKTASIPFRQAADMDFFKNLFITYSGSWTLLVIFAFFTIIWLITAILNKRNYFAGWFLFSSMVLPFASYWVVNPSPPMHSRYFIYLLPIYLLIVANGIVSLIDIILYKFSLQSHIKVYITILLVISINLLNVRGLMSYYQNDRSFYNDASIYLLRNIENRDIIFYEDMFEIEGLLYYLDKNGKEKIFIASLSNQLLPYPPYFFRPMDKRGLITPELDKKKILIAYTWEKDIETLIKSLPRGYKFWFISKRMYPDFLRFSTDKWEYSKYGENYFIYHGQQYQ